MLDLNKNVKYIKGVGPNKSQLLNKLGIFTLNDLITYFPRAYEDRSKKKNLCDCLDGEVATIEVVAVSNVSNIRIRNGKSIQKLQVKDETGTAIISWFNQPYLKDRFLIGHKYRFYGKIKKNLIKIELNSPVFDDLEKTNNTGKIIPLYPLTYKLTQNAIRKIIENGLLEVKSEGGLKETLPDYIINENKLEKINNAIFDIHFPNNFDDFRTARYRLVFEELLSTSLALLQLKNNNLSDKKGIEFNKDVKMSDVINTLPFKLTKAQLRVLEEIDEDMESKKSMNRLLQGDVGSRKNNCINNCSI